MAISRGPQASKLRPATLKSDSSQHRSVNTAAEESRRFRAAVLAGVSVRGAVKGWTIPRRGLGLLMRGYLKSLGIPGAGVALQLVDDAECQGLNRSFRAIDAPTDVLSFPAEDRIAPGFDAYLGEIALDLPYAWRKRGRFHPRFEGEAAFLLLHGLLHLTGRHHDTPAQERALWRLQDSHFPPRPALLLGLRTLRPKA
jgi:probable rRNA maturation factor